MIRRLALALALVLALTGFALPASATPLLVSESGTFSQNTPNSALSTPGGTFAFSFQVDSNPAVIYEANGYFFVTSAYKNFTYTLNGVSINKAPIDITFYSGRDGGLLSLNFSPSSSAYIDHLNFNGDQVYSGDESSPTILNGSYAPHPTSITADNADYVLNGVHYTLSSEASLKITPLVAATPEPSSIALLGTGLLGMAGMVRRRLVRA